MSDHPPTELGRGVVWMCLLPPAVPSLEEISVHVTDEIYAALSKMFENGLVRYYVHQLIEEGRRMNAAKEPRAEMRQMASEVYQIYNALRQEGFTERQAMEIIDELIRGSLSQG